VSFSESNTQTLYSFGNLTIAKTDVALEQVKEGRALVFHQNPNASVDLLKAEDIAKSLNLGFWVELGSNEMLRNWVASSTVPDVADVADGEIDTLGFINYAAENARTTIFSTSLVPCVKWVPKQRCVTVWGKKICTNLAPQMVTAPQKWVLDLKLPTISDIVKSLGVGATATVVTQCGVTAAGATGVSAWISGGVTAAAKSVFDGSMWLCLKANYPNVIYSSAVVLINKITLSGKSTCQW